MTGSGACPCCGRDVAGVEREVVFRYPDAIVGLDDVERARVYAEHGRNFAAMPGRAFVRALLPVRLTDGHEFRFGVWLEVPEATGAAVYSAWDDPAYIDLSFDAHLANTVPPWGERLLGAACTAVVRDVDELPYIGSSTDEQLARVLSSPWSRTACEKLVTAVWGPLAQSDSE